ncbi:hypothetical protein [Paenibacillus sp. ISL-20]|uniref:hypothetical protein n=1 Tax=Paenibacillus sp. ISL-20 TaxID=2819163 RepID=UPI001BE517B7|nr:hypothetical protein [Paenibacillus sp. ISL-20]MBT2762638.1 hypothetical protein [Paenibacillus sp. ISL-20]
MHKPVSKAKVKSYVGKQIVAYKKDGTMVTGKLVRVSGNRLFVEPATKGKKVKTKAILPLALFDLLAIGTAPYAYGGGFGGYPGGYPGGFGGFGPGFGGPGFGAGFGPGFFW